MARVGSGRQWRHVLPPASDRLSSDAEEETGEEAALLPGDDEWEHSLTFQGGNALARALDAWRGAHDQVDPLCEMIETATDEHLRQRETRSNNGQLGNNPIDRFSFFRKFSKLLKLLQLLGLLGLLL